MNIICAHVDGNGAALKTEATERPGRRGGRASTALALAFAAVLGLSAATPLSLAGDVAPAANSGDAGDVLSGRRLELRGMEDTLQSTQAQRAKIEAEVAGIRTDRAKLEAALVDLAKTIDDRDQKIAAAEARLDTLKGSEEAIRRSLDSRRAVIVEVLAALQRMGRKPPPALLVAPEDMLAAIRTSMMLGAVLPEMRADTEALASDLSDLLDLRRSIAAERERLRATSRGSASTGNASPR